MEIITKFPQASHRRIEGYFNRDWRWNNGKLALYTVTFVVTVFEIRVTLQRIIMENYLVISALGKDGPGIVDKLSLAILDAGCSVFDSRMTVLGGEFAIIMLVSGKWNELVKLEDQLPSLETRLGLNLNSRRTEAEPNHQELITYTVEVIAIDHPGIVHQIAGFFSARSINIRELNTSRYAAAHTGTPMFSLTMTVDIPTTVRIAPLREEFLDFCDDLNMDAVIEPIKLSS